MSGFTRLTDSDLVGSQAKLLRAFNSIFYCDYYVGRMTPDSVEIYVLLELDAYKLRAFMDTYT
jgi:hypothetical protein